jgi:serine/threonine-protein kinase RsbW
MTSKRIIIPSSVANLHAVNHFIEDICDHYNIFNSYFSNILTAVTEAVVNAIEHGNKNDSYKHVEILFSTRNDGLCFTVSDQGVGFDPESLPDPTNPENDGLLGRGLFVMKSLSDELIFSNGGSTVELFFSIAGIDQELAVSRKEQVKSYFRAVKKTTGHTIR